MSDNLTICLSEIADSVLANIKESGVKQWPFPYLHPLEVHRHLYPELIPRLLSCLDDLSLQGKTEQEIARLWRYPSKIVNLICQFEGSEATGLPLKEVVRCALRLVDYIVYLRGRDPFCLQGVNVLLNDEEIERILQEGSFVPVTKSDSKLRSLVSKTIASLFVYTELLFMVSHALGHEIHGPYRLDNGKQILLVREFYDLRPPHWPGLNDIANFPEVTLYELYAEYEPSSIRLDILNRTRYLEPILPRLQGVALHLKGQHITVRKQLTEICAQIIRVISKVTTKAAKLSRQDYLRLYVESLFFGYLHPITDALNQDWRPSNETYAAIDSGQSRSSAEHLSESIRAIFSSLPKKSEVDAKEIMRKVFDPRYSVLELAQQVTRAEYDRDLGPDARNANRQYFPSR